MFDVLDGIQYTNICTYVDKSKRGFIDLVHDFILYRLLCGFVQFITIGERIYLCIYDMVFRFSVSQHFSLLKNYRFGFSQKHNNQNIISDMSDGVFDLINFLPLFGIYMYRLMLSIYAYKSNMVCYRLYIVYTYI